MMIAAPTAFAQDLPRIPRPGPGVHDLTLLRPGEPPIRYALSAPADYSPERPVPLVLALHYGGNPAGAGRGVLEILVRPALAGLGAIIAAPDSLAGAWNTLENERAVNFLLDALIASYNIDEKRVVVTGFSMGGAGVWHMAARFPDRFSAAIPVAGRPAESAPGWRIPVFAVHSRNDEVVPIGPAETRIAELRRAGVRAEMVTLTGITHHETNRHAEGLRKAVAWLTELWK
jgi:predicted peptidase